jgi:hypothetical protein
MPLSKQMAKTAEKLRQLQYLQRPEGTVVFGPLSIPAMDYGMLSKFSPLKRLGPAAKSNNPYKVWMANEQVKQLRRGALSPAPMERHDNGYGITGARRWSVDYPEVVGAKNERIMQFNEQYPEYATMNEQLYGEGRGDEAVKSLLGFTSGGDSDFPPLVSTSLIELPQTITEHPVGTYDYDHLPLWYKRLESPLQRLGAIMNDRLRAQQRLGAGSPGMTVKPGGRANASYFEDVAKRALNGEFSRLSSPEIDSMLEHMRNPAPLEQRMYRGKGYPIGPYNTYASPFAEVERPRSIDTFEELSRQVPSLPESARQLTLFVANDFPAYLGAADDHLRDIIEADIADGLLSRSSFEKGLLSPLEIFRRINREPIENFVEWVRPRMERMHDRYNQARRALGLPTLEDEKNSRFNERLTKLNAQLSELPVVHRGKDAVGNWRMLSSHGEKPSTELLNLTKETGCFGGWCIARDKPAEDYLSKSENYLYTDDQGYPGALLEAKPQGKNKWTIKQIQGVRNNAPSASLRPIIADFLMNGPMQGQFVLSGGDSFAKRAGLLPAPSIEALKKFGKYNTPEFWEEMKNRGEFRKGGLVHAKSA